MHNIQGSLNSILHLMREEFWKIGGLMGIQEKVFGGKMTTV